MENSCEPSTTERTIQQTAPRDSRGRSGRCRTPGCRVRLGRIGSCWTRWRCPAIRYGRWGHTVNEVAVELCCDWHTVNDTVVAYGMALVDDPDRIGEVAAVGLDEVLFARQGRWRTQTWSTSIADVERGQLPDQAGQARRARVPTVRQLPDPRPALRRPTQLGATPNGQTPLGWSASGGQAAGVMATLKPRVSGWWVRRRAWRSGSSRRV